MNSNPKLKFAILGCGQFPRRYHVPVLRSESRASLALICDTCIDAPLRELGARTGAALTADPGDLFAPGACDAVIVSTPHALHAGQARQCLEHGKHVLVDKPFVLRSAEARELSESARSLGVVTGVAFNRRFDSGCQRARTLIQSGALGEIRFVETVQLGYETRGWFLDLALGGGGPFTGRGAHMADLLPWLLGRDPDRVRAVTRPGPEGKIDEGGFIEIEFGALHCHLTCLSVGLHMWDEVRIFGDKGLIELRRPLDIPLGWEFTHWGTGRRPLESMAADGTPGAATRDFIDAICDPGRAVACSFEQAWISVRIVELAFESAGMGGEWRNV